MSTVSELKGMLVLKKLRVFRDDQTSNNDPVAAKLRALGLKVSGSKDVLIYRLAQATKDIDDDGEDMEEEEEEEEEESDEEPSGNKSASRARVDRLVPLSNCEIVDGLGVMLNQVNIRNNNNKFYVIQLVKNKKGHFLWTRWGRVGENGQNNLAGPSSKAVAYKAFCKKFRDKTKNNFEDVKDDPDSFQTYSGKYTLLKMAVEEEDDEEEEAPKPKKKKPVPKKKAAPKKKAVTKRKKPAPKEAPSTKKAKTGGSRARLDRMLPLDDAVLVEGLGVMLNQVNIKQNNNKFYVIQLVVNSEGHHLWTRWGRVGENGQNNLAGPFDYDSGYKAFCKKFKDKTKNNFADILNDPDSFQTYPKKYTLLKMADDPEDDEDQEEEEDDDMDEDDDEVESTLPQETQDFIQKLYSESTNRVLSTLNCDMTKNGIRTPLGLLAPAQLDKGDLILDKIHQELQKDKPSKSTLVDLSSEYYTNIPHKTSRARPPPVIDSIEVFEMKKELQQLLSDMLLVQKGHKDVLFKEDIDDRYEALECNLEPVLPGQDEYINLLNHLGEHYVQEDHDNFNEDVGDGYEADAKPKKLNAQAKKLKTKVKGIFAISKDSEEARYDPSIDNEHLLVHASHFPNYVGILSRGLLLPKAVTALGIRRTDFGWLGSGVYFGSEVMTSMQYAGEAKDKSVCLLIFKVALGNVQEQLETDGSITGPKKGYHSLHGNPDVEGSEFQEHEYCVYDQSQYKMAYIIHLKNKKQ